MADIRRFYKKVGVKSARGWSCSINSPTDLSPTSLNSYLPVQTNTVMQMTESQRQLHPVIITPSRVTYSVSSIFLRVLTLLGRIHDKHLMIVWIGIELGTMKHKLHCQTRQWGSGGVRKQSTTFPRPNGTSKSENLS